MNKKIVLNILGKIIWSQAMHVVLPLIVNPFVLSITSCPAAR